MIGNIKKKKLCNIFHMSTEKSDFILQGLGLKLPDILLKNQGLLWYLSLSMLPKF